MLYFLSSLYISCYSGHLFVDTVMFLLNFSTQEPVMDEDAIIKFSEESGLPVALDETIDRIQNDPVKELARYAHPGIVAIVSYV